MNVEKDCAICQDYLLKDDDEIALMGCEACKKCIHTECGRSLVAGPSGDVRCPTCRFEGEFIYYCI